MKKLLTVTLALAFLAACNNYQEKPAEASGETKPEAPAVVDITQTPEYTKGLELIGNSDCLTCHSVTDKIIGPSYQEVADKYASAPDTIVSHLASKIIHGGKGVWGEVAMTPHPNVSQEDAEAMIKYVLLLKK